MNDKNRDPKVVADSSTADESIMVGGSVSEPDSSAVDERAHWASQIDAIFKMTMHEIVRAEVDMASPHRGGLAWEVAELKFPEFRRGFDFFRVTVVERITAPLLVLAIDAALERRGVDPTNVPGERRAEMGVIFDIACAADVATSVFRAAVQELIDQSAVPVA